MENGDVSWEDEEYFIKWEMYMRSQKENKSGNEDIADYNYHSDLVSPKEIEVEEFELKEESDPNPKEVEERGFGLTEESAENFEDEKPVCINIKSNFLSKDISSEVRPVRGRGKPRGPYKKSKKVDPGVNTPTSGLNGSIYCDICEKTIIVKKRTTLTLHKFKVHDIKNCDKCGKLYNKFSNFASHVTRYCPCLPKVKVKCGFCGRGLASKFRLKEHIKAKHSERELCDICDKMVVNLSEHKEQEHNPNHIKSIKQCHLCGFTSSLKTSMYRHMQSRHKEHVMVNCPYCGKQVRDLNLTTHIRTKQCDRPEEERTLVRFQCDQCEKTFTHKKGLRDHIKNVHNQEKNFKCELCDYKSFIKANVYLHVKRVHEKRALYVPCPHCDEQVINVEYHIKIVHKEVLV